MSILATDILIKSMFESALTDLRANPWILDDIFGGLAEDALARTDYGYKEVEGAKKWFLSQDIPVLLQWRMADTPPIPCISIAYKGGREMTERTSLGDMHLNGNFFPEPEIVGLLKVYDNFTPKKYDKATGIMTFPDQITTKDLIPGQFLVSEKTGKAYIIKEIVGINDFKIAENVDDDFFEAYIAPPTSVWNVQRELTYFSEGYSIGIHAQGNPSQTMWLWQVAIYALFRYKEAFLEGRGFELSTLSFSGLEKNNSFPSENIFSRYIELDGQVQANWIKYIAPKLQTVKGEVLIEDGPKAPDYAIYNDQGWFMIEDKVHQEAKIKDEDKK